MALPTPIPQQQAEERMRRAIEIAKRTPPGDVPVGAVIYSPEGEEIAVGWNRREADGDPTAHAEVVALRQAGLRLDGCELVVTLEPCVMCAGAAVAARVGSVVFGAWEPRTGAAGSLIDALRPPHSLHTPQVRGGILEAETAGLLTDFFTHIRK